MEQDEILRIGGSRSHELHGDGRLEDFGYALRLNTGKDLIDVRNLLCRE